MNILLIDDEPLMLEVLSIGLESAGHSCRAFRDPREAVSGLNEWTELVVCDVTMPEMDGFEVATRVKAALGVCPPRTLLISGDAQVEQVDHIAVSEIIGLLQKPFLPSDLIRIVDMLARTRAACPGRVTDACVCPHVDTPAAANTDESGNLLCDTPCYAQCGFFERGCGRQFRKWISNRDGDFSETLARFDPARM